MPALRAILRAMWRPPVLHSSCYSSPQWDLHVQVVQLEPDESEREQYVAEDTAEASTPSLILSILLLFSRLTLIVHRASNF